MENARMNIATGHARPSRLIAEALVLGHDAVEVTQRAEAMGLPRSLTEAVISVCCREDRENESSTMPVSAD